MEILCLQANLALLNWFSYYLPFGKIKVYIPSHSHWNYLILLFCSEHSCCDLSHSKSHLCSLCLLQLLIHVCLFYQIIMIYFYMLSIYIAKSVMPWHLLICFKFDLSSIMFKFFIICWYPTQAQPQIFSINIFVIAIVIQFV